MPASLHPQESERIKALADLQILDSLPEKEFDHITRLAAYVCQTPIALISLVDTDRQWFKSKHGLSIDSTSRDVSFCSHAILKDSALVVDDAREDMRFRDNPLVTGEERFQFYAGVSIKDPVKHLPIGTLCVIDRGARRLSSEKLELLEALADQVNLLLRVRNDYRNLRQIEKQMRIHRTAFDQMLEGMVFQNFKDEIIGFNPSALKHLGLTESQLLRKSSFDPDWSAVKADGTPFEPYEHPSVMAMTTGKTQENVLMGIKTGDRKTRWLMVNSSPICIDSEQHATHTVTTFADVTDLKTAEELLVNAAKMSSLGEMAANMAHEINSPLAIINISAHQIREALSDTPAHLELAISKAEKIQQTVRRIDGIITGLRNYSRSVAQEKLENVSLTAVLEETTLLCAERLRSHDIRLELDLSGVDQVRAHHTPLLQIFVNLISNAVDAIAGTKDAWIRVSSDMRDGLLEIAVTDCGRGIPLHVQKKMMNPFFTTKGPGKGTGLGLGISQKLAEKMGATLRYNPAAANTQFLITLPTSDGGHV